LWQYSRDYQWHDEPSLGLTPPANPADLESWLQSVGYQKWGTAGGGKTMAFSFWQCSAAAPLPTFLAVTSTPAAPQLVALPDFPALVSFMERYAPLTG
jgi:hypothetical protein